ncbi:MAG: RluA family pseudouridine synthase [Gammaproteobacteria bacterium]|nr:RluA family pseudouridine synthase [Gammaproteobacteria bacterium]
MMDEAQPSELLEAEVPGELAGERADRVAARLFAEHSRALLSRWIKSGALVVDGEAVKPNRKLSAGQRLTLTPEATPDEDWATPQPVEFNVVYEDDQLLVIDKPAGLVAHPGAGNPDGTLVNGLLHYRCVQIELPRAGLVHRLDQDTSGLLVVAATRQAQRRLAEAVAQHRIARRYLGIAEGVMTGGRAIDKPIGRDPHHRTRQRVRGDGRPARTRVGVRQRFRAHTYVSAELETGRTHQIRVHLASIGHPLVGDRRYGARGRLPRAPHPEVVLTVRGFQRQALHASELAFDHPATGERCEFRSPLPKDMAELLAVLTLDAETHGDER